MKTVNEIGEHGKSVNLSVATTALNIAPDLARVKKYDEYPAKLRKLKLKKLFWFMIFAAPTAMLIAKGYPWWSIIPGLGMLWNLYIFIMYRNASPQVVYEDGHLVGAVIVSENPLQIAAMAPMNTGDDTPVCWGVKRFDLKELPLHQIKKGERVPCAVMFGGGMLFAGLWSNIEAHPACWATSDVDLLDKAKNAIDETEWKTLETLAVKAAERTDVDFSKNVAYFNEDLSPRIDLHEKVEKKEVTVTVANPDENFLMKNVCWSFCDGKYETLEKFAQTLAEYNQSLDNKCDINEIILSETEVTVRYGYVNEEDEDIELDILLSTKNESGFTAAELLYQIHNQVFENLENEDHHFFEGLVSAEAAETGNTVYLLELGS